MASNVGLFAPGLPITGSFAFPFATYFTFLSGRVVYYRLKEAYYVGDNSSKATDPEEVRNKNKLFLANRCHQNFTENVPLGLVLAALAELNGGSQTALTRALGLFFLFRVSHAELGLIKGLGIGRPLGYYGTMGTILYFAGYTAYLVKGYWGY